VAAQAQHSPARSQPYEMVVRRQVPNGVILVRFVVEPLAPHCAVYEIPNDMPRECQIETKRRLKVERWRCLTGTFAQRHDAILECRMNPRSKLFLKNA
jgi:hypothetical protein